MTIRIARAMRIRLVATGSAGIAFTAFAEGICRHKKTTAHGPLARGHCRLGQRRHISYNPMLRSLIDACEETKRPVALKIRDGFEMTGLWAEP